ncbi:hypothetical protein V1478_002509 [Vespula squamosa]|uniref:Uncharacterized protein n=1 Tax=Vespula squamosa TaxID=30214 RepID=A0ABD2BT14_VESSQ
MQRKGRCELKVSEYAPVSLEGVGTHELSFSAPREESEAEGDREILRGWWMGMEESRERQASRSGQTVDGPIRERLLQAKG